MPRTMLTARTRKTFRSDSVKEGSSVRIDISSNPYGVGYKYGHLITNKNEGRRYVVLFGSDGIAKTSVSYARFILASKLGRVLVDGEQADHIDNNRMNDSYDNIQLLTASENIKKYVDTIVRRHGTSSMSRTGCKCDECRGYRRMVNERYRNKIKSKETEIK